MMKRKNSPWLWIPTLFATEAIVSATIIYVVLLMFIQLGTSFATTALFAAALMIPSIGKLFIKWNDKWNPFIKTILIVIHALLFTAFVISAFIINSKSTSVITIFVVTFCIALINAVNEKVVAVYYNLVTNKRVQSFMGNYRFVATQIAFIVTYGVLIIFVGLHEIFFRNIWLAWSMEYYFVAGVLLILLLFNALLLQRTNRQYENRTTYRKYSLNHNMIKKRNVAFLLFTALLLLPQALLFCTRLFFLMTPESKGGLGCTLQDVGFIQGTIGVIAFMVGTFVGQHLLRQYGNKKMFWGMILPLLFSPFFYFITKTCIPKPAFLDICLMTVGSQLCFGFGLNICILLIKRTTDVFDDNILSLIHVPLVVITMAFPIAVSGVLLETVGFKMFFMIYLLLAAISLVVILISKKFIYKHILNVR